MYTRSSSTASSSPPTSATSAKPARRGPSCGWRSGGSVAKVQVRRVLEARRRCSSAAVATRAGSDHPPERITCPRRPNALVRPPGAGIVASANPGVCARARTRSHQPVPHRPRRQASIHRQPRRAALRRYDGGPRRHWHDHRLFAHQATATDAASVLPPRNLRRGLRAILLLPTLANALRHRPSASRP